MTKHKQTNKNETKEILCKNKLYSNETRTTKDFLSRCWNCFNNGRVGVKFNVIEFVEGFQTKSKQQNWKEISLLANKRSKIHFSMSSSKHFEASTDLPTNYHNPKWMLLAMIQAELKMRRGLCRKSSKQECVGDFHSPKLKLSSELTLKIGKRSLTSQSYRKDSFPHGCKTRKRGWLS